MKKLILALATISMFALTCFIVPAKVYAATPAPTTAPASVCQKTFILPTWYKYLKFDPVNPENCDILMTKDELPKNIVLIGLAIIEMLLMLAGIVAVFMVIIGGFKYVISQGEPDKISNAKSTIINALLGAVIAIIASQVVAYVGGAFGNMSPDNYGLIHVDASDTNLQKVLKIFFAIIGAVSVFMIVLAGFNFITSGGNSEKVAKARRTIYYALIGLVVAIFATAIVSFVLKQVT